MNAMTSMSPMKIKYVISMPRVLDRRHSVPAKPLQIRDQSVELRVAFHCGRRHTDLLVRVRMTERAQRAHPRLNAAVVGKLSDISETSIAELDEVMTVNVSANKVVLDCLFELCPRVAQVVAVSSHGAVKAARGTPAYCLSKAALNMLIALYAKERPKTHFSAVAPWIVNTEMQEVLIHKAGDPRFPSLRFLEQMRDAGEMWTPTQAATELASVFKRALDRPSGTFLDASTPARHVME